MQPAHADDAAVPAHQGRASALAAVLPHGGFLRAVLRRCAARRQTHRHHADLARPVRGRTHPDGRRALSQRRHLSRAPGAQGRVGGDLRADRRPREVQGTGRAPGGARGDAGHGHRRRAARTAPRNLVSRGRRARPAKDGAASASRGWISPPAVSPCWKPTATRRCKPNSSGSSPPSC